MRRWPLLDEEVAIVGWEGHHYGPRGLLTKHCMTRGFVIERYSNGSILQPNNDPIPWPYNDLNLTSTEQPIDECFLDDIILCMQWLASLQRCSFSLRNTVWLQRCPSLLGTLSDGHQRYCEEKSRCQLHSRQHRPGCHYHGGGGWAAIRTMIYLLQ